MTDTKLPLVIPAAKLAAFYTNARKILAARPEGDKDLRRASKLYAKKESPNG